MDYPDLTDYSLIVKISKPGGHNVIEIRRCADKIMDNMADVWRYNSKKPSTRGKSTWMNLKDIPKYIDLLVNCGFTEINVETKD